MEMMRKTYENIAQRFFISSEQLLQDSLKIYLLHRKQAFLRERFEILSRYAVTNANELEEKIKQGILPEHPIWEELIDLINLEQEIIFIELSSKTKRRIAL